jgi:6-phosphogluconolactonase
MRKKLFSGLSAALLAALATLAGCVSTPEQMGGTFAYVSNSDSKEIYVMRLNPQNGDLTVLDQVALKAAGPSTPMTVSPDKRYLYAAIRSQPFTVAAFSINPYGRLTSIGEAPLANSMAYVSTDRTGKYLLSASYGGHMISVNPIGADGVPKAPHQTLASEANAHLILTDPSNQYAFVPCLGFDAIMQLRFDASTGKLSPNEPSLMRVREKSGPRHMVFHPNGKYVYLVSELDGTLYVFSLDDKSGTLALHQVTSALPAGFTFAPPEKKIWTADIHITPNGKFLYTSERTSSTISSFKVGPDGVLSKLETVPTETQPRGFNIDPSGRYLLSVGQVSNGLTSYAIDGETGKLTKLKQYPVGKNPNWVEIVTLP